MNIKILTSVLVALSLQMSLQIMTAPICQAEDYDVINSRGYSDDDKADFSKPVKGKPTDVTFNYEEDAKRFVAAMKSVYVRRHHKGSFKQNGAVWVLSDDTDKSSFNIKWRHNTARKKADPRGLLALAELYPKSGIVLMQMSRQFEGQKNWAQALDFYRRAQVLAAASTSPEALVAPAKTPGDLAQQLASAAYFDLMMGHYATAIKQLDRAIELDPASISNYKNRAQAYRKLHKDDLAVQDEKKLKELVEDQKQHRSNGRQFAPDNSLALLCMEIGSYDMALEVADKTLKKDPKSGPGHLARARVLVRLGRYEAALADYKALMAITKDAPSVAAEMAVAAKPAKNGPPPYGDLSVLPASQEKAQRKFPGLQNGKRVILSAAELAKDHKGDFRVYLAISSALKKNGSNKELNAESDKLLEINPVESFALVNKIEANDALRNWPEVEKNCTRYIGLLASGAAPVLKMDFVEYVYSVRSLARRAQKNFAGAIEDENTVLKLAPGSSEGFRDRGDCYMQSGKFDLAVADYTKAIQFDDSKSGGMYLRRATAYDKLKKSDLARQDRESAAKLNVAPVSPKVVPD